MVTSRVLSLGCLLQGKVNIGAPPSQNGRMRTRPQILPWRVDGLERRQSETGSERWLNAVSVSPQRRNHGRFRHAACWGGDAQKEIRSLSPLWANPVHSCQRNLQLTSSASWLISVGAASMAVDPTRGPSEPIATGSARDGKDLDSVGATAAAKQASSAAVTTAEQGVVSFMVGKGQKR